MAKGKQAKYVDKVAITTQSVSSFLDMLAKKGLREKFLAEAPQGKTVLEAGQKEQPLLDTHIFSKSASASPKVLADGIDQLAEKGKEVPGEIWEASLSVEPDLMEFARTFVVKHRLTADFPLAKSLQARRCGNGIECPRGQ
ncbi:hypothetical protein E0H51_27335 [Rhizobium leguminosarum bv. viciae]|uniref:hypothetical protein n=1 Tax=Rhizobium leguminosarum TaxID=384 RepID=UPI00103BD799|nr:hypothetical protein [Rhizobium leguminosarum]TBY71476.1 hypothetical protein E0H51_27335 [Rhizobium leguminosarum bv. viciae]